MDPKEVATIVAYWAPVASAGLAPFLNLLDFMKYSREEFAATSTLRNDMCRAIRYQIGVDIVRQLPAINGLAAQLSQVEFSAQCSEVFTNYLGTQSKPLQDHMRTQRLFDSYAFSFRLSKYGTIPISIVALIAAFVYVQSPDACTRRLLWWAIALLLGSGLTLYVFRQIQKDRLHALGTEYEIPNGH